MAKILIKTDKNGTKHWAETTCQRCGGAGGSEAWAYTGYTCYDCGGSGIAPKPYVWKEYTPEYEKILEARRQKAYEKKLEIRKAEAKELNKKFYERYGFNENGKAYVALGNTYPIKDELKEKGFRFNKWIGWYSDTDFEDIDTLEFDATDAFCVDNAGALINDPMKNFYIGDEPCSEDEGYLWEDGFRWEYKVVDLVKQLNEELKRNDVSNVSEYIGSVGDKVKVEVTVKREVECVYRISSWCTNTSTLFIMEDAEGNVYTWKTASLPTIKTDDKGEAINRNEENLMKFLGEGDKITLKGTVKEHTEYNGVKQTVLTRCKVVE